jgi:hypothetical protein
MRRTSAHHENRRVEADELRRNRRQREIERAERRRLLTESEQLVLDLEALLFRHDPMGINYETNLDEYRSEAETITLRRAEAKSVDDVRRIVNEEFIRWFDGVSVVRPDAFDVIARETWALWCR